MDVYAIRLLRFIYYICLFAPDHKVTVKIERKANNAGTHIVKAQHTGEA